MKFTKAFAVVAGLSALSACGGGGTGLAFAPVGSGPITNGEMQSWATQFENLSTISDADIAFGTPNVASASYNGIIEWPHENTEYVSGRISLDADFTGGTIEGRAGDFSVTEFADVQQTSFITNEVLAGTLAITNGTITDTTMVADMNGTLTGAAGSYGVSGTLDGEFVEVAGQSIVGGFADGTISNPNATQDSLLGVFMAFQE